MFSNGSLVDTVKLGDVITVDGVMDHWGELVFCDLVNIEVGDVALSNSTSTWDDRVGNLAVDELRLEEFLKIMNTPVPKTELQQQNLFEKLEDRRFRWQARLIDVRKSGEIYELILASTAFDVAIEKLSLFDYFYTFVDAEIPSEFVETALINSLKLYDEVIVDGRLSKTGVLMDCKLEKLKQN